MPSAWQTGLATAFALRFPCVVMNVIAEGAEPAEQISLLNGMNCDCVQGYCFSGRLKLKKSNSHWKSNIPPGIARVSAPCQSEPAEFCDSTIRFGVRPIAKASTL